MSPDVQQEHEEIIPLPAGLEEGAIEQTSAVAFTDSEELRMVNMDFDGSEGGDLKVTVVKCNANVDFDGSEGGDLNEDGASL